MNIAYFANFANRVPVKRILQTSLSKSRSPLATCLLWEIQNIPNYQTTKLTFDAAMELQDELVEAFLTAIDAKVCKGLSLTAAIEQLQNAIKCQRKNFSGFSRTFEEKEDCWKIFLRVLRCDQDWSDTLLSKIFHAGKGSAVSKIKKRIDKYRRLASIPGGTTRRCNAPAGSIGIFGGRNKTQISRAETLREIELQAHSSTRQPDPNIDKFLTKFVERTDRIHNARPG